MFNYENKEEQINPEDLEAALKKIELYDKPRVDEYRKIIAASTTPPVFLRDCGGTPWLKVSIPVVLRDEKQ